MSKMFDHERLRVYQEAIAFVVWLDGVEWTAERTVSAHDHLARASAGMPVNIAEASGKWSVNERRQLIDTAYGSSLECAACLDVLNIRDCLSLALAQEGKGRLSTVVSMLIGFRQSTDREVREERVEYGTGTKPDPRIGFDHERLDVYRKSLDFVRWCVGLGRNGNIVRPAEIALDKAATGVALNIAEGNGKFSANDRCRFIGHARTAALQATATLDVLAARQGVVTEKAVEGKMFLVDIVRMLVAWHRSLAAE